MSQNEKNVKLNQNYLCKMKNNIETPFNKNTNIFFTIKIIVIIIKIMKRKHFHNYSKL